MAQTIFTEYIKAIEFGELSLGTLPPIIYGDHQKTSRKPLPLALKT
ncbi:hypothetical protein RchiOBHm_Chr1g0370471 [Rosa chinensis]|uniref:Uncharacterized protein n=1 Tax=Rosa chinensis TaxID=74649 RepID=A0A2P6SLB4_ROSCH|nr:hypothetical protein RchiOBHm_Chr1g0370471 [Rosa chinensis]